MLLCQQWLAIHMLAGHTNAQNTSEMDASLLLHSQTLMQSGFSRVFVRAKGYSFLGSNWPSL